MIFESTYRRKALQTWDMEKQAMKDQLRQSLQEQKESVNRWSTALKFPFTILQAIRKN